MAIPKLQGLEIVNEVGRGAFSSVYRVRKADRDYALKVLNTADSAEIHFVREAANLARLANPHLVETLEVGSSDGQPYLIMEFVEGQSLAALLASRSVSESPLDQASVVSLALALCSALNEVHRFGLVHRDIKPQNILLSQERIDRAKLIDFGLAIQADATDKASSDGAVAGTFAYSAPEQTGMLARPVDGRSDLYSLGVVLFECATGKAPYSAPDAGELIRLHLLAPIPDAHQANPRISPVLARIIAKLMAKDPDERYASAESLWHDLEKIAELTSAHEQGREVALGASDRFVSEIPLIGRESELARIRLVLEETQNARQGRTLLVEGLPGCGKSRIVRELLARGRDLGALILGGKCSIADPSPLSVIRHAIDGYLASVSRLPAEERKKAESRLVDAARPFGAILKRVSPSLGRLLGEIPELTSTLSQDQFYSAISEFLLALSRSGSTLVLVLDDIQWLDEASWQVVRRLSHDLAHSPLLIACTARNDEASLPRLTQFVEENGKSIAGGGHLKLVPLSGASVEKLIEAHLGNKKVNAELVAQLNRLSEGNPFAIGEYVRAMLEAGLLRPNWGSWLVDLKGLESLKLSSDVIQLVIQRITHLDPATQELLSTAAVIGSRFDLEVLPAVARQAPADAHRAIAEAMRASLIERDEGELFRIVHDRVREAFLARLDQAQLAVLHRKLARSMEEIHEQLPADRRSPDWTYAIARHYAESGGAEAEKTFEWSRRAGLLALENFSAQAAYDFLKLARKTGIAAGKPRDAELERSLGNIAARLSQNQQAMEYLQSALEIEKSPMNRAQIFSDLAYIEVNRLQIDRSWKYCQLAAAEIGAPIWKNDKLYLLQSVALFAFGTLVLKFPWLRKLYKGDRLRRIRLQADFNMSFQATVAWADNPFYAISIFLRVMYLEAICGKPGDLALYWATMAFMTVNMGKEQPTLQNLRRARETALQGADPQSLVMVLNMCCMPLTMLGRGQEAEAGFAKLLKELGPWAGGADTFIVYTHLFRHQLRQGRTRESRKLWEQWLTRLQAMGHDPEHFEEIYPETAPISFFAILGQMAEASRFHKKLRERFASIPKEARLVWIDLMVHEITFYLEQKELGEPLDRVIAEYEAIPQGGPIMLRYADGRMIHVMRGYARWHQTWAAAGQRDSAEYRRRKAQLEAVLKDLSLVHDLAIHDSHYRVLLAGHHLLAGRIGRAENELIRAEEQANRVESHWVLFEVARMRARIHAASRRPFLAQREARLAHAIAQEHGWANRARWVLEEFGITQATAERSQPSSGTVAVSSEKQTRQNQLKALLDVSLASASTLDPDRQVRKILDELARILGAERAFLFLVSQQTGGLELKAGRDHEGNELKELSGFSSTVVRRIQETREPLILSGTEEGQALGSESVVVHNLRSIIAAPLMVKDRFLGVVYLDNRLARGIFSQENIEILTALANQIAVAIQVAHAAQVEVERKALEKDLALTAAVQSLFLPRKDTLRCPCFELAGHYQAATHCGGDWWWHDQHPDGSTVVLVGDVTGHGPGPAMVTAAVASVYQSWRDELGHADIGKLVETVHRCLLRQCEGKYTMTLMALRLSPDAQEIQLWSAGAPPAYILGADGKFDSLSAPGNPLGSAELILGTKTRSWNRGDRLFIYTDGVTEMVLPDQKFLGGKGMRKLLQELPAGAAPVAREELVRKLAASRGETPLNDDITFVLIDKTG